MSKYVIISYPDDSYEAPSIHEEPSEHKAIAYAEEALMESTYLKKVVVLEVASTKTFQVQTEIIRKVVSSE
jgi:hypothetical protein